MAFGFKPHQSRGASSFDLPIIKCYAPATEASAMYIGQPVVHVGDSNDSLVKTESGVYEPGSLLEVDTIALADAAVPTGIIVGIERSPSTADGPRYKPASTEAVLHVVPCLPNILFQVEADGPMVVDDNGLNTVGVNDTSGSTSTGLSSAGIDADATADASNPLTIVGLAPIPGNAWTDANPIVLVRFNACTENPGAIGIA